MALDQVAIALSAGSDWVVDPQFTQNIKIVYICFIEL
jgi:hypothetical protein